MTEKKILKTCPKGHKYYKSTDCPTCPICESEKSSASGWMSQLSAPVRRALEGSGIKTVKQLATHSEKELLQLHGFGPASLPVLRKILKENNLSFNK